MRRRRTTVVTFILILSLAPSAHGQTASRSSFVPVQMADEDEESSVVVQRGDHLWKISARHLEEVLARPPGFGEVAPYWSDVIDTNRDHIRSGNPNLIFPGEVVKLPPISGSG